MTSPSVLRPRAALWVCAFLLSALLAPTALAAPKAQPSTPTVSEQGFLAIAIEDDFQNRRSKIRTFLDRPGRPQIELTMPEAVRQKLKTGDRVQVRGHWRATPRRPGASLSGPPPASTLDTGTQGVTLLASAQPVTLQAAQIRRAVVMLVDITDGKGVKHALPSSCDNSTGVVSDRMFGLKGGQNVDGCYADISFNQLGFGGASYPGRTSDIVRVSITDPTLDWSHTCNITAWQDKADSAAASRVTLGTYQHRVYLIPANPGCAFAGLGYLGCDGPFCRAAVMDFTQFPCGYKDVYLHELGHNLGMHHAATDLAEDPQGVCPYCDSVDFMGYSIDQYRGVNAPHKEQMGWMAGRMQDGTLGGTFTLDALEILAPTRPQILKLHATFGSDYSISYRPSGGYDNTLPTLAPSFVGHSWIHRFAGGMNLEENKDVLLLSGADGSYDPAAPDQRQ